MANRIKVSNNFYLDEFVDPITYKKFNGQSIWFLDNRLIKIAQFLRELTDRPITINNWINNGTFKASGFRRPSTRVGGYLSQHKFGKAIDVKVSGIPSADVLNIIMTNWPKFKELGLTTVEDIAFTTSWNHLDIRHTDKEDILIVKP